MKKPLKEIEISILWLLVGVIILILTLPSVFNSDQSSEGHQKEWQSFITKSASEMGPAAIVLPPGLNVYLGKSLNQAIISGYDQCPPESHELSPLNCIVISKNQKTIQVSVTKKNPDWSTQKEVWTILNQEGRINLQRENGELVFAAPKANHERPDT